MQEGAELKESREKERVMLEMRLDALEHRLGHPFVRRELLRQALTHSSYSAENKGKEPYERLEFLGDRVLELMACDRLFRDLPDEGEGDLTKRLAWLVDEESLTEVGRDLGLEGCLRLGGSVDQGRLPESILGDAVEALVGALYLDGGMKAAERFFLAWIWDGEVLGDEPLKASPLNLLQETCDRPRLYICHAMLDLEGRTMRLEREGRSKKRARREAARALLEAMGTCDGPS
ncbi:MAG: hypothetical protein MUE65_07120 [Methanomassiliicoccales archaeon]|nr:hypothetical protein [Methanomassiliicoccales archaeon]